MVEHLTVSVPAINDKKFAYQTISIKVLSKLLNESLCKSIKSGLIDYSKKCVEEAAFLKRCGVICIPEFNSSIILEDRDLQLVWETWNRICEGEYRMPAMPGYIPCHCSKPDDILLIKANFRYSPKIKNIFRDFENGLSVMDDAIAKMQTSWDLCNYVKHLKTHKKYYENVLEEVDVVAAVTAETDAQTGEHVENASENVSERAEVDTGNTTNNNQIIL